MYSRLDLRHINATIATLHSRIGERFPGSGLQKVAAELLRIGEETGPIIERAARPHWPLRIAVGAVTLLFVVLALSLVWFSARLSFDVDGIGEFLFVLSHPRVRGATGAWVSPLAIV